MTSEKIDYWEEKELDAAAHASCIIDILDEMIDYAVEGEPVEFWVSARTMCQRLLDAFDPECVPGTQFKDNVISMDSYKATTGR